MEDEQSCTRLDKCKNETTKEQQKNKQLIWYGFVTRITK